MNAGSSREWPGAPVECLLEVNEVNKESCVLLFIYSNVSALSFLNAA